MGVLGRLLGHLEPSRGDLEASWRYVVSYLGPCWAILSDLGGHLGLSEALLEQSWAILGALTARDRPRPGPGGRGRGKPLPEGEEEGWKKGRGWELNHSRPKGLVGLSTELKLFSLGPHASRSWTMDHRTTIVKGARLSIVQPSPPPRPSPLALVSLPPVLNIQLPAASPAAVPAQSLRWRLFE